MKTETKAYACFNVDEGTRKVSSSGGIYFLLAQQVIKLHGTVYAVCYDENFETVHCEIRTELDLMPSLGSKYVPSRLGDTFRKIKKEVLAGKLVLFIGTPCQCAGLLQFLKGTYDNLVCVDFICHGVPSRIVWRKYLSKINPDHTLTFLNMRDKSSGWSGYRYSWNMQYKEKSNIIIPQNQISYMKGFASDFYLRPSCYECRFKGVERSTDITLGDYWGVWEIQPEMDDDLGTSIVLLHSSKGKKLFEKIQGRLTFREAVIEKIIQYNPSIISNAVLTPKRKQFFRQMNRGSDFEYIIKDLTREPLWKRLIKIGEKLQKSFLVGSDERKSNNKRNNT